MPFNKVYYKKVSKKKGKGKEKGTVVLGGKYTRKLKKAMERNKMERLHLDELIFTSKENVWLFKV